MIGAGQQVAPAPHRSGHRPPIAPARYRVRATRADGHCTQYTAIGGASWAHAANAMDAAGPGGKVSVMRLAAGGAA